MQVKRKLALFAFASGLALAAASAEAAPVAGISQAAPAVSASENTNAPISEGLVASPLVVLASPLLALLASLVTRTAARDGNIRAVNLPVDQRGAAMQGIGFSRKSLTFMQNKRWRDRQWRAAAFLGSDEYTFCGTVLAGLNGHKRDRRPYV